MNKNSTTPLKLSILLFVITLIGIILIDAQLKTTATPFGILSFEFCGFSSCTDAVNAWTAEQQRYAMLSLGFDYAFMLGFGSLLTLLTLKYAAPKVVVFSAIAAPVFDAVENVFLILYLQNQNDQHAFLGSISASIKFCFVFVAVVYLLRPVIGDLSKAIQNRKVR